jgi:uncharacterized protein
MFGIPKLLLLALLITVAWYGLSAYARLQRVRRDGAAQPSRRAARGGGQAQPPRGAAAAEAIDAEDMEKCPECGAWAAPRLARSCGRPACPYGRMS